MFSIKESIKYGWQKSKENLEVVFFSTLIVLALGGFINGFDGYKNPGFSLFMLIVSIFMIIVRIGYNKIFLRIYDGEKPKFVEIFNEYRIFWRYLGVSILFPFIVFCGLILLIIPGLILAIRLSFSPLIVVDTKIGPIEALKESYAITKGSFWKILLFWLAIAVMNLLGLLIFGIGLLLTVPVSTFATIYVYRLLSQQKAGLIETPRPDPSERGRADASGGQASPQTA